MGFAVAITSVPVADKDRFLANAGLRDTGEGDAYNETLLSGADWQGQFLTWRNLRLTKRLASPLYEQISAGTRLLTLELHETSMGAQASLFENGQAIWSATGDDNGYMPEGPVPLDEAALKELCHQQNIRVFGADKAAEYAAEDGDFTDPFAMVVELFVSQTGFRYDGHEIETFTELAGEMPFPKPWWRFW